MKLSPLSQRPRPSDTVSYNGRICDMIGKEILYLFEVRDGK